MINKIVKLSQGVNLLNVTYLFNIVLDIEIQNSDIQ